MLLKKKPFPGDADDQQVMFPKMGAKPTAPATTPTIPAPAPTTKKKAAGKGASFWASKAAATLAKK